MPDHSTTRSFGTMSLLPSSSTTMASELAVGLKIFSAITKARHRSTLPSSVMCRLSPPWPTTSEGLRRRSRRISQKPLRMSNYRRSGRLHLYCGVGRRLKRRGGCKAVLRCGGMLLGSEHLPLAKPCKTRADRFYFRTCEYLV